MAPDVRRAGAADADAVTATLAAAFADDPFVGYVLADETRRPRQLPAMFGTLARQVLLRRREVLLASGGAAVAVWAPPGTWRYGTVDNLRLALPMLRTLGRAAARSARANALVDAHHPSEPHWYLELLGTRPDAQGRGLASACLDAVHERCDAERVGAYLWTSKEANLAFYAGHGYAVTHRTDIAPGVSAWSAWRDPR